MRLTHLSSKELTGVLSGITMNFRSLSLLKAYAQLTLCMVPLCEYFILLCFPIVSAFSIFRAHEY